MDAAPPTDTVGCPSQYDSLGFGAGTLQQHTNTRRHRRTITDKEVNRKCRLYRKVNMNPLMVTRDVAPDTLDNLLYWTGPTALTKYPRLGTYSPKRTNQVAKSTGLKAQEVTATGKQCWAMQRLS